MHTLTETQNYQSPLSDQINQLNIFIGNTPLYPILRLNTQKNVRISVKPEWRQFGGSVKVRPAYGIIKEAIQQGKLTRHNRLLDASSGNTGIAYAHIGTKLDIPVTLCIPENASKKRKQILKALGVDIHFTPGTGGMAEAREVAKQLYKQNPDKYYYADQYNNTANRKAHYKSTGPEILDQTDGKITHFIAGLGTTGTFTGTGRFLKDQNHDIKLIALQPDIAMHGLEGWKHLETAHTPSIYDDSLADEIRTVSTERAHGMVKQAAQTEGLLLSPSSAANLAGALQLADEIETGTIVTVLPDNGSKYDEIFNQLF